MEKHKPFSFTNAQFSMSSQSKRLDSILELEQTLTEMKSSSVAGSSRAQTIKKLEEKVRMLKSEADESVPFVPIIPRERGGPPKVSPAPGDTKMSEEIRRLEAKRDSLRKERSESKSTKSDSLRRLEKMYSDLDAESEPKTSASIIS